MATPSLRIEINGELIAVAGAEELTLLTGQVGLSPASPDNAQPMQLIFNVMGLALGGSKPRQLSWGDGVQLKLGDRVTFQLLETDELSPPSKVLGSPSSKELTATSLAQRKPKMKREPQINKLTQIKI